MSGPRKPHRSHQQGEQAPMAPTPAEPRLGPGQGDIAGLVGDATSTRSGDDTRRRGWFWHWNSIVTQYAPLIGLKGVGLLNSYTVWTDRREESPHRGYAFPSQQREADFYGEDRAELITINKILVALDLIEIRKEMVLRADEQGRRWRVPHNFYRVKDKGDGFNLTGGDVMRVVELADRDRAVYRYVRHIFSAKFQPIDRNNVWTAILEQVRENEVWQRLAARTAKEEDRASARTRAGHAARKANLGMPTSVDTAAASAGGNDTDGVKKQKGAGTSVASTNKGPALDVAPTNKGSSGRKATNVDPANNATPTSVAPTNRTYHQEKTTTTTTRQDDEFDLKSAPQPEDPQPGSLDREASALPPASQPLPGAHSSGPAPAPPADGPGQAAALRAFEEANGRASTPAERKLLAELASRFEPSARAQGDPTKPSGWSWVGAAIYEAVEAGSAFVAPRRIREILSRWERDGLPGMERTQSVLGPKAGAAEPAIAFGDEPDIPLPHGHGSRRTWSFTVALLANVIEPSQLERLFTGTAIAGYRDGEVTISVPDAAQASRIAGEYSDLIARKLSEAMRRPVRISVLTGPGGPQGPGDAFPGGPSPAVAVPEEPIAPQPFVVDECRLPSDHVWMAILEEIVGQGSVSHANLEAWLRPALLVGRGDDGSLIVGAPNELTRKRVSQRFLPPLRAAAAAVLGVPVQIEVVLTQEWLTAEAADDALDPPAARTGA